MFDFDFSSLQSLTVTVMYNPLIPEGKYIIDTTKRRLLANPEDRYRIVTQLMGWDHALDELRKDIHKKIDSFFIDKTF